MIEGRDKRVYCQQGPEHIAPLQSGDLDGLRFVFKDLFDVDGYTTGAGNPAWLDSHHVAKATSPLLTTLLNAGAECVGRVQTDELAYSLEGRNTHYGMPINPVAPDAIPGGSSSGCAVAVAMNAADFALGTDTGGSVRVPASYCGLFGLRPTWGKLSLEHCFPLARSFDTAGLFASSLTVLNKVLNTLTQLSDTSSQGSASHSRNDSLPRRLIIDEQHRALLGEGRISQLSAWCVGAGYELKWVNALTPSGYSPEWLSECFRVIQGHEIITEHGEWLSTYGHSLATPISNRVAWARTITSQTYEDAKVGRQTFSAWLQSTLEQHDGFWVLPTTPGGPPKLETPQAELDAYRISLMGLTSIAGLSGLPQLHIPMMSTTLFPMGISLMGSAHSESILLQSATALIKERAN